MSATLSRARIVAWNARDRLRLLECRLASIRKRTPTDPGAVAVAEALVAAARDRVLAADQAIAEARAIDMPAPRSRYARHHRRA